MMAAFKRCSALMMSFSGEKIEGNYDLLVNILSRLPPKPFFRFKAVSKKWKNILENDAYFLELYIDRRKKDVLCGNKSLLAFIEMTPQEICTSPNEGSLMDVLLPLDENIAMEIPRAFGHFVHSSNGLILCGTRGVTYHDDSFHVLNPLTRKSTPIPPRRVILKDPMMALVCEEEDDAHQLVSNYKILVVTSLTPNILQTYSSETRRWEVSEMVVEIPFYACDCDTPPLVSNGVVHWYSTMHTILLYDSTKDHLEDDQNRVQVFFLPKRPDDGYHHWRIIRTCSEDVLWYCMTDQEGVKLWTLPKGEHGNYIRSKPIPKGDWICSYAISWGSVGAKSSFFTLQALVPLADLLDVVIMGEDGIYLFNLKMNTLKLVQFHGHRLAMTDRIYYPYMESHSLSSYFLLDSHSY